VHLNGVIYEALIAAVQRRDRRNLYHSALEVRADRGRYVIEMAPIFAAPPGQCGVVAEGAVGTRRAAHSSLFRYGIRCWRDGSIPDAYAAVESPRHLSEDGAVATRLLDLVPSVPTPVWGRDELNTGEMWNSNSVIAWLLTQSAIDAAAIEPPAGGRAPGWQAGVIAAREQHRTA